MNSHNGKCLGCGGIIILSALISSPISHSFIEKLCECGKKETAHIIEKTETFNRTSNTAIYGASASGAAISVSDTVSVRDEVRLEVR